MREILFRGKGKDSNKWYEGYYMALSETTYCFTEDYAANPDNTKHYIVFDRMTDWGLPNQHWKVNIDPETLGQYTGLKDRNYMRIFEGDIVRLFQRYDKNLLVEYRNSGFTCTDLNHIHAEISFYTPDLIEVIGNIHDNPELIEGE